MDTHRFHLKIDLKLEAVTCPGVWLCSHGYLEITIKVLGYFFRTGAMEPFLPVLCHDHFQMEGYFKKANSIAQLVSNLSREHLEITMWQNSRRLAYYDGVLMDLFSYMEPKLQCPHTNTKQLLLKTTPAFPGIIAPKVDITTKLLIEDKVLNLCKSSEDLKTCRFLRKPLINTNPVGKHIKPVKYQRPCIAQIAGSKELPRTQHNIRKQKTVCHARNFKDTTNEYSYSKLKGRRDSITSSCVSDNTHTSVGIYNIEHDGHQVNVDDRNHNEFCKLCRLYKDVFLI